MSLVSPEKFLKRCQTDSSRSLAILVYKRLTTEIDPKCDSSDEYLEQKSKMHLLAFKNETVAEKYVKAVENRVDSLFAKMKTTEKPEFRMLPPLFLLSNDHFMIHYDDVFLFAFDNGPIIPVVHLQRIREKNILDQLIVLYSKSAKVFMNIDNIREYLTPQS